MLRIRWPGASSIRSVALWKKYRLPSWPMMKPHTTIQVVRVEVARSSSPRRIFRRAWNTLARALSAEQRERYSRHFLLPEVGTEGQQKLLDAKVLLLGAGGLGSPTALYLAAGVAATWPAVTDARSKFLSGGAPAHGEASPGDHLQTLYHYWLVGHQLEHGRAPWRDPYTFRPEAKPQANFSGWPYGILFWPLGAALGLVAGWNVLQILLYVLAGLAACAWLRELDLPRGPALAGGLAFAIAPYRVEQSVGHLLGPISILIPVSLWAFERARRGSNWWLLAAGAALASIPLSGQVHLALGAIPFFVAYALCRTRDPRLLLGAVAGAVAAVGAGALVRELVIKHSTQAGGRSLDEISFVR